MQTIYVPSRSVPPLGGGPSAHDGFDSSQQSLRRSSKAQIEQLLTANRLKDEFMAILGHELRSPLVALQNAAHILSADAGHDILVQQKMHALIERQLRHMVRLTSGLQDLSSISRGQLRLQRERIDLRVVLADAIETMEPELQRHSHHVTTRWPDAPVWLQGDADRLDQVFQNLLGNASKYTNPGGALALSLLVHDRHAVVRVRDSGIGITAAALPDVFTLFMQVDRAAPRARPGLGIGLTLVKTLVELHGGRVSALSAGIGHGSEFTVRLPIDD
jgi:two-component system, sensor histidine kinase